jgi:hypothetical protein
MAFKLFSTFFINFNDKAELFSIVLFFVASPFFEDGTQAQC